MLKSSKMVKQLIFVLFKAFNLNFKQDRAAPGQHCKGTQCCSTHCYTAVNSVAGPLAVFAVWVPNSKLGCVWSIDVICWSSFLSHFVCLSVGKEKYKNTHTHSRPRAKSKREMWAFCCCLVLVCVYPSQKGKDCSFGHDFRSLFMFFNYLSF